MLPEMEDLRCMSFTAKGHGEILAAGCQKVMFRIDVDRGAVIEELAPAVTIPYTLMRRAGHHICAASHDGAVHILDPHTLTVTRTFKAYAGTINDMDARGDHLLTCGWAPRHYQGLALEQLVRVFDLKSQRPAPPMSFPPGAAYVRMHPKLSSTCMVVSQSGAIYSIDVLNPEVPTMRFAATYDAHLRGLEMMPSGNGFALLDTNAQLILWGSPSKTSFVEFGSPLALPDSTPTADRLHWTTDAALNTIGMPFYRDVLLSSWSNRMPHEVPVTSSNSDGLPLLQKFQAGNIHGQVGSYPRRARRYQTVVRQKAPHASGKMRAPKFLSEKPRDDAADQEWPRRMSEDIARSLNDVVAEHGSSTIVPTWYQVVEIRYSKFGVDDFDFAYYNSTKLSGLETHIVNSYANGLLQLFRFVPSIRNLALDHAALDCRADNCITCELGYLFDMLEKAQGKSCQATNFLKMLSRQPNAEHLGILEDVAKGIPLTNMVQNLNRVLVNTIAEHESTPATASASQIFGMTGLAHSRCGHCSFEASHPQVFQTHELVYPSKAGRALPRSIQQRFSHILKASVERYDQQRGWCSNCQGYKVIASRRTVHSTPNVLMLDATLQSQDAQHIWNSPGFLPKEIGIIVKDGQFFCYEGQDLKSHLQRRAFDISVYELVGVVADINLGENKKSHMVSVIDTAISNPGEDSGADDWHIFNDFLVRQTPATDALHFDSRWKLPSVVAYQIKNTSQRIDNTWSQHIDTQVLYRSVTQPKFTSAMEFYPLQVQEPLPDSQTHVAIDAEFVRLLREEIDVGADGTRTITRPHRSGLARVSVLRADGPQQGIPFIDDYIRIDEPIDDYLTEYSGLKPGDLNQDTSPYILENLQTVYKKLWILLNLGVRFIGHGLKSDFRTINIHVPESQVIDTQELFSLGTRARRKLSLRFLAWLILKEDIQQDSVEGHDSVEDALTAYKLWRKYLEYMDAGILEDMLDEIWMRGKAMDFRVPAERDKMIRNSGGLGYESPSGSVPNTPARRPAQLVEMSSPLRNN